MKKLPFETRRLSAAGGLERFRAGVFAMAVVDAELTRGDVESRAWSFTGKDLADCTSVQDSASGRRG